LLYCLEKRLRLNTIDSFSFEKFTLNFKEMLSKAGASKFIEKPEVFIITVLSQEERNIITAFVISVLLQDFENLCFNLSSLL